MLKIKNKFDNLNYTCYFTRSCVLDRQHNYFVPVIVANRVGRERFGKTKIDFFGGSFIADGTGAVVTQVGGVPQKNGGVDPEPVDLKGYTKYTFDLDALENHRAFWGLYRDRRPELYSRLVF